MLTKFFAAVCLLPLLTTLTLAEDEKGFLSLMPTTGKGDWEETVIVTPEGYLDGDGCYLGREFGDFILRFDFKTTPGANSGMGIRSEKGKNAAFHGMEIQVLEDTHPKYANLKDWQYHGSIYGVVAAKQGAAKPVGEWNTQEIYAKGDHIKVTVNGKVIVDARLSEAAPEGKTLDNVAHPGLHNPSGFFRLCGHGGGVQFRNIRVKPLD